MTDPTNHHIVPRMSSKFSIRDIDHGILFLMAEWSGPAQWAWRQLSTFLDGYPGTKPNVVKVEWHEADSLFKLPELDGKVHALGEAMVVKAGQIVFLTVLGKEETEIQVKCQELLRVYEGQIPPRPNSASH